MPIGRLAPLQPDGLRLGRGIGCVVVGDETEQQIADRVVLAGDRNVLNRSLAPALQVRTDRRRLFLRRGLVDRITVRASGVDGHRDEAVVMARYAAGLLDERDADVLQEREAAFNGGANRGARRRCRTDGRRECRSSGIVLRRRRCGLAPRRPPRQRRARVDLLRALVTRRPDEIHQRRPGIFHRRAVPHQHAKRVGVAHAYGFAQRRDAASRRYPLVGAVVEQQRYGRRGADDAAGDNQRGSVLVGSRIHVGAGIEQQLHRPDVGHRPHQRGRAGLVRRIRIGARVEQPLHECRVAVQCAGHQLDRRRIVSARFFARCFVGPVRALVDPLPDDLDLPIAQRRARRHPLAEARARHAVIQPAAIRVARADVGLRPAAHRVGAAIEPEAGHLHFRTVAADAVVAKDRLHIALKVDRRRRLLGGGDRPQCCDNQRGEVESFHGTYLNQHLSVRTGVVHEPAAEQRQSYHRGTNDIGCMGAGTRMRRSVRIEAAQRRNPS